MRYDKIHHSSHKRKQHYVLHYDKCVIVNMFGTVLVLIPKIWDWISANKVLTIQIKLIFTIDIIIVVMIITLIDKSLQCYSVRLAKFSANTFVSVRTERFQIDISLIYYRLCSHSPHVAS